MMSLRCLALKREHWKNDSEKFQTETSKQQQVVENTVSQAYDIFVESLADETRDSCEIDPNSPPKGLQLKRVQLENFLQKGLTKLSEGYQCLDASRPWICFWILHSLELLNIEVDSTLKSQLVKFLSLCQCDTGGYAGGPGQLAHLAPTYASIMSLCIIGTEEAYTSINRDTLSQFLTCMHQSDGSFIMHEGGEVDIRGCYLAASVARILNISTEAMFDNTAQWIVNCQTYEGGFGGIPGMEAHGGYAYCGIAALTLLGHERLCDLDALLRWAVNRQMQFEGGFQGRTNKLVDSCYSFWQSAIIPIIASLSGYETKLSVFHNQALQEYLLLCCQHTHGGFIDKPGKHRDYYHTCYALSGLSISQNFTGDLTQSPVCVLGPLSNHLVPVHPLYNLCVRSSLSAVEYFLSSPQQTE